MNGFLIFVGIALIIGVVKYFNYKKQFLEQIALNPKNIDIKEKMRMGNDVLRFGLLFIGISLGIIGGAFLNKFALFSDELFGYLASIFFCGGIMLVVGYFLDQKEN